MKIHNPKNEQMLDELYAWISFDEGGEGIISASIGGQSFPLVFGHTKMIEVTRPTVEQMARQTGKMVRLVKYKKSDVVETLGENKLQ